MVHYLSDDDLEAALDQVLAAPRDSGRVEAIVVRLATDARELRTEAYFSPAGGLAGDRWAAAGEPLEQQVSLMNVRLLRLLTGGDEQRMVQAGDNLVVDLDLGDDNLPAGGCRWARWCWR